MSLTPYAGSLEFTAAPSRALGAWLVLGHGVAGLALLYAGAGWLFAGIAWACLPASLSAALRPLGPKLRCIMFCPETGWRGCGDGHQYFPMELTGTTVVTSVALFAHWAGPAGPRRLLLPRDSFSADGWRRLTVLARFHDAGGTHC
ncbi:MAG: hypothetical protein P8080_11270 [Gammaproteobacteria bacterium]